MHKTVFKESIPLYNIFKTIFLSATVHGKIAKEPLVILHQLLMTVHFSRAQGEIKPDIRPHEFSQALVWKAGAADHDPALSPPVHVTWGLWEPQCLHLFDQ